MLWSIACIVVAIGIGCALVSFIDQETYVNYRLELTIQELERRLFPPRKERVPARPLANFKESFITSVDIGKRQR